ncbi:MAG: heme-binding protein [Xanthobacteraceae bacterium]|nr:heme-binding protein [Xanthobacteraceae bacterium]
MRNRVLISLALGTALTLAGGASAQQPPGYGPDVTLDVAKKAAAAAEAEAGKNGWHMAIVVVTTAGELVHFSRMDDTQFGSTDVAIRKAKSAAAFRRPTKVFQDAVNASPPALPILTLGAIAVEGGLPLIANGKVVGAIGCSGGTAAEDGQACRAGAATMN